jgi:glycine/D-amino acid oxidase-like deaminating enzyme
MIKENTEVIVVGGGVIGVSLAYGMVKNGAKVILIDKVDNRLTASRGNFGLVWVQGKGKGMPRYVEWCIEATEKWPEFAENLETESGFNLNYEKTGGLNICLGEEEHQERVNFIEEMSQASSSGSYDCEMISIKELQGMIPEIKLGKEVSGASFCSHDGCVNPLNLLKAMSSSFQENGGGYRPEQFVQKIEYSSNGFKIETETHSFNAKKLVLACGLMTTKLASMVGMKVPVIAERGQIIVTESTSRVFNYPTAEIRQNYDGSFMLGASHEAVGYNIETSYEVLQNIAKRAIQILPSLKNLQMIRSWAALRVLTPDKMPVYLESDQYPGAYAITSHSGVSLASLHSSNLVEWILEERIPPGFTAFHPKRFNVQEAI